MSSPSKALWLSLLVWLPACSTDSHLKTTRIPDWEDSVKVSDSPAVQHAATPVLSLPPSPPKPPPNPAAVTVTPPLPAQRGQWVSLNEWARAAGLPQPLVLAASSSPTWSLRSARGVFVLRAGSQIARWDGIEVYLGFAPQVINGQLFVNALDLQKTVEPLLSNAAPRLAARPLVVVIDPGHGGENAGARSALDNHYEKEFTLDWALRLQRLLRDKGCQVFLTRSDDSDLALSNRVAFALEHHADAFLSLHFNSNAPGEAERGLETYCLTPAGMPSSLTRGFADESDLTFANNALDTENLELAVQVHRALLQVNGHRDRGVRRARFLGVLRGQQCAAILVEGGYLSNPDEAGLIARPEYRQKLAEAVASALLENAPASGVQAPLSGISARDTNTDASMLSHSIELP